jgi:two-component system response regulator WspF
MKSGCDMLLAIGASAGGPAAVATVLRGLPPDFPAAIVVVQHVDEQFAHGMAEWLSAQSPIPVRIAADGDRPVPGLALLAGTSDHLVLGSPDRLAYTPDPRECFYRPSVDAFFHSVHLHWRGNVIGVLLTGMGRDGAEGLKALRDAGHHTVAQDEASSVVYGMPKAAVVLGAAVDVLPVERIARALVSIVSGTQRRG